MIWPSTELSTLRARELDYRAKELDYNRQIASLSARLDALSSENSRLHAHLNQYIDDLRGMAHLKELQISASAGESENIVATTMMREKVNELKEQFLKRDVHMDMLDQVNGFYKRYGELNTDTASSDTASPDSPEASVESSD